MAYLSQILNNPVTDPDGTRIGLLADVIATLGSDLPHPVVVAVVVKHENKMVLIPVSYLAALIAPAIPLSSPLENITPYTLNERDFYLREDVMDKQIIDTDDVRVVRVNDIELVRVNGSIVASNVDVGTMGILRRVGLESAALGFARIFKMKIPQSFISWDDVELLTQNQQMRLKVPGIRLSELHPADLANIITDMNGVQTSQFLDSLNLEQLADTLEEVEPDFQASLIQTMTDEKVADVLEEMSPDEAADLLAELSEERSSNLLQLMDVDDAKDVRKLLTYPVDSAGGIMTTEFTAVGPDLTAEQTIAYLRENAEEAEMIYYVYVVDPGGHLLGVFSLSDLILAKPNTLVTDFMHKRIVSMHLLDSQDKVAQLVAKYNLLAVPVVDDDAILQGIVTSDDALDKIIPTAWKKRLPHYYR